MFTLFSPLLTDLYQLSMMQVYWKLGMTGTAVFEFFVRKFPNDWNFFMTAGLEQVLKYLENLRFDADDLDYLKRSKRFDPKFIDYLGEWRFSGDVHAMPEGELFFPSEPILRVTAPIIQAQLVETRIINLLQFQSLVASKASRCILVAPNKQLIEFGLRRAHGSEAGLLAARASYIAGFDGTSDVLAEKEFGIPIYGTMAHSFVEAHDDEVDSFGNFSRHHTGVVVLLIDTYDTEEGAHKVARLVPRLTADGIYVKAVRIDSGDLAEHAHKVRTILDESGCSEVGIFASGSLDEHGIAQILKRRAPVDGFGVGSKLTTIANRPYLDCAYKLTEYGGRPVLKTSEGKKTWAGRKQVYRKVENGQFVEDHVTLEEDNLGISNVRPLLKKVMERGICLNPSESLETIRGRASDELASLPKHLRTLKTESPYPVIISNALRQLAASLHPT